MKSNDEQKHLLLFFVALHYLLASFPHGDFPPLPVGHWQLHFLEDL